MRDRLTRRGFVRTVAAGSAALTWLSARRAPAAFSANADKPALLGGTPVHQGGWPQWPEWRKSWEPEILKILRSGHWYRGSSGGKVPEFEAGYAKLLGAKRCLATANGTTALITSMQAIGIDAGDEIIVSPYTFIATYNAILIHKALPVFADTDPATWTMDPASIESRITDRTRLILTAELKAIPGIAPARLPENSRAAWHLFPMRYDPQTFNGLSRSGFIRALRAEGVPCSGVYHEQYFDGLLDEAIASRSYQRLFSKKRLKDYRDSFQELKGNRKVCATTVGLSQTLLLADRADVEHIIEAIRRIHAHSAALAKAS